MSYCVGLTGGIASGKSTVAELFSELGVPVIYADQISRALCTKKQPAFEQIVTHFGSEVLQSDGELNRNKLRDIIFSNPHERVWLEQLLHPLIRTRIQELVTKCTSAYCIVEIPLLIDRKAYPYINRVLLVRAPEEIQIERVMQRDRSTRAQAEAILTAQPDMNMRLQYADDVIINDLDVNQLREIVEKLHHNYQVLSHNNVP